MGVVDEELCFYECLSVERNASGEEIKRSFMRLAKRWHPDRNKAPEAQLRFQQISTAYEVLSDEESRRLYDAYGADVALGKKPEPGRGHFGSRGPAQRKGEDCEAKVRVTLPELYTGTTKTVNFSRIVRCGGCDGKGARGRVRRVQCRPCGGTGVVVGVKVLGGMFMQHVQSPCDACEMEGSTVHPEDACSSCRGSGKATEAVRLKVPVACGLRPGEDRVRLGQEGHAGKNCVPGDLVVHLEMVEDTEAKMGRVGSNLVLQKSITLLESLVGFVMVITHLDGREILVRTSAGEMVKHGDYKVVKGEGMPEGGNISKRGDLIIKFLVEYPSPEELSEENIGHLLLALPGPAPQLAPKDAIELPLDPYSLEQFDEDVDEEFNEMHGAFLRGEYDSDSEEDYYESGPSACAHQ